MELYLYKTQIFLVITIKQINNCSYSAYIALDTPSHIEVIFPFDRIALI